MPPQQALRLNSPGYREDLWLESREAIFRTASTTSTAAASRALACFLDDDGSKSISHACPSLRATPRLVDRRPHAALDALPRRAGVDSCQKLSAGLHWLNGRYAREFNKRHGRFGHVFAERFQARVIESEEYLFDACEYVAQNPVAAGLCDAPEDWPWSYRRYGGGA